MINSHPQIKIFRYSRKTRSKIAEQPGRKAVLPLEDPEQNKIIADRKTEYVDIFCFDCSYRGIIIKIF